MQTIWQKITHRNGIAVWIIPLFGVLILGAVLESQFRQSIDGPKMIVASSATANISEVIREYPDGYHSGYNELEKPIDIVWQARIANLMTRGRYKMEKQPVNFNDPFFVTEFYDEKPHQFKVEDFVEVKGKVEAFDCNEECVPWILVDTITEIEEPISQVSSDEQDDAPILTEKEIYQDPYIKHLRLALNNYLKGSNEGIEDEAVTAATWQVGEECGLANFDKAYYKSKFFIYSTEAGKYGGRVADIVFVDKPDTLFETLIYQYGTGEYVLRYFCKNGPPEDQQADFTKLMQGLGKELEYSL